MPRKGIDDCDNISVFVDLELGRPGRLNAGTISGAGVVRVGDNGRSGRDRRSRRDPPGGILGRTGASGRLP